MSGIWHSGAASGDHLASLLSVRRPITLLDHVGVLFGRARRSRGGFVWMPYALQPPAGLEHPSFFSDVSR